MFTNMLSLTVPLLALVSSTVATSTNASTEIFPITWQITSLNGQQLAANSTGTPHYSYVAFAFTDSIYRSIIQCSRKLQPGDYKTQIADGKYYPCENSDLQFALEKSKASQSGYALGLSYTFADPKGVFTTDCGTVHAQSLDGYYELDGATTGNYASGYTFDDGRAFIPFQYNETAPGKTAKCKPKRLGGPF